jgi:hypothetical protein
MKKLFKELEMLSEDYFGKYSQRNRVILERRYQAFKLIKLGIHTVEENRAALEIISRLMDISDSNYQNKKDTWLLKILIKRIQMFEKIVYC